MQCCAMLGSSVVSNYLGHHGLQPARLLCPWGFSWQKCWSGLPCPSPGDLPKPGIEPRSPALKADSLPSKPPGKPHGPRQVATYSLLSETLYAWLYICAGQMKEGCICVQDRLTQALVMYTSLVKWETLYASTRHKRANRYSKLN